MSLSRSARPPLRSTVSVGFTAAAAHPDAHLAGTGLGVRQVDQAQDLGTAELRDPHGAHGRQSTGGSRSRPESPTCCEARDHLRFPSPCWPSGWTTQPSEGRRLTVGYTGAMGRRSSVLVTAGVLLCAWCGWVSGFHTDTWAAVVTWLVSFGRSGCDRPLLSGGAAGAGRWAGG